MKGIDRKRMFKYNILLWKKLLGIKHQKPEISLLRECCAALEGEDFSCSFRVTPNNSDDFNFFAYDTNNITIIMQGPLRLENNYTLETVKLYRKLYPCSNIIISTWTNENQERLKEIEATGATIVLSEYPKSSGQLNINYQIVNTLAGISKANDLGAKYICKTRSDQRILKPNIFSFLINLMTTYPSETYSRQDKRLVVLPVTYGNMFYPYFISDFFYFGTNQEMNRLFNIELDHRTPFIVDDVTTKKEESDLNYAPEVYLFKHYLQQLGFTCENTIESYWESIKRFTICVDSRLINLQWPKYINKYYDHEFYGEYFQNDNAYKWHTANIDFVNWVNLYHGLLEYDSSYEILGDYPRK